MARLTRRFVEKALSAQKVWDLGNEVLYDLCAKYPDHSADNVILAKTWLIGRAYAAAIERRRNADGSGAKFNKLVARKFRQSQIDSWFKDLRADKSGSGHKAIETHKRMTDLLQGITDLRKRSFASKYLHFHFPKRFYLYDTRADKSARKLIKLDRGRTRLNNVDVQYADFFARCEQFSNCMNDLIGRIPTPREVDQVLLQWEQENS